MEITLLIIIVLCILIVLLFVERFYNLDSTQIKQIKRAFQQKHKQTIENALLCSDRLRHRVENKNEDGFDGEFSTIVAPLTEKSISFRYSKLEDAVWIYFSINDTESINVGKITRDGTCYSSYLSY